MYVCKTYELNLCRGHSVQMTIKRKCFENIFLKFTVCTTNYVYNNNNNNDNNNTTNKE